MNKWHGSLVRCLIDGHIRVLILILVCVNRHRRLGTKGEAPEVSLGPLSVANEVLLKLESARHLKLDQLAETDVRELAHLLRTNNEVASRVQRLARSLPQVLSIRVYVQVHILVHCCLYSHTCTRIASCSTRARS